MRTLASLALVIAGVTTAASEGARPGIALLDAAAEKVGNRRVECPAQLVADLDAREAACIATELNAKQLRKQLRGVLRGNTVVSLNEFDWFQAGDIVEKRVFAGREMFVVRFDVQTATLALVPSHGCFPPDKLEGVASVADAEVAPAEIVERATPNYPVAASESLQTGFAMTQVLVLPDGAYGAACTLYVAPPGFGFRAEARRTVARHTFRPALRDGKPVPYVMNVSVTWEP